MDKAFEVASFWTQAASRIIWEETYEDEEAKPDGRKRPRKRRRRIAHSESVWANFSFTGVATFLLYSFQTRLCLKTSVCVHTTMNLLDVYLFSYLLFLLHTSLHSYAFIHLRIYTLSHPYVSTLTHPYIHTSTHSCTHTLLYTPAFIHARTFTHLRFHMHYAHTSLHSCIHAFISPHEFMNCFTHLYSYALLHIFTLSFEFMKCEWVNAWL